jgi:TolB-like protein/class 3 adenylate cyclase/Tfp pilus assembly protein PilF
MTGEDGRPILAVEPEVPFSQLTAIWFADVAEYSTAMNRDELATMKAVHDAMDLIAGNIRNYGGRLLNFMGDGVVASFNSATNAIIFSLTFQEMISRLRLSLDQQPFGFRIGITIGEIFLEGGRPQGNSVNLAQRIQSLAPVGGTVVTGIVYEAVRARSEFDFEYLGSKLLKSMEQPTDVYQVHRHDVAASLRPITRSRSNHNRWRLSAIDASESFDRPSIAILPLRNLSGDSSKDFFADGTTDDIITNLTRFRALDVIARGSTFAFRNPDTPMDEISRRLRARYVAHGSIRRSRNRVVIHIELDDVARNQVVWAENYDRNLEDIFEIQGEIANLAVAAMAVTIEKTEQAKVFAAPPQSLDAYGLVLLGDYHMDRFSASETAEARRCYQNALEQDPTYGRARAGKSRTYSHEWKYSWSSDPEGSLRQAALDAETAIELDPNDARGHAELGFANLYAQDHDRSILCYRRALDINPNDANVLAEFADVLAHAGEPEDALTYFNRAMRLNPIYPDIYVWYMAGAYFKLRAYNEAVNCILRMRNRKQGRRLLAASYAYLGRISDARRIGDEIRVDEPRFSAETWARKIVPDKLPEHREQFFCGLKLAGL